MAHKHMEKIGSAIWAKNDVVSFFGATIETRMFVVRLNNGELFVCSPTWLTPELKQEIDSIGLVKYVVSPNKIHNQCMGKYLEMYPESRLYASPGLKERRNDLQFYAELQDEPESEWEEEIDQAIVYGNSFFQEVLFYHKASQTLIVCDLIEHINEETLDRCLITGWKRTMIKMVLNWMYRGLCDGKPLPSPEFQMYTNEEKTLRDTIWKLVREENYRTEFKLENFTADCRKRNWDFVRILMCHGEFIEQNAQEHFSDVLLVLLNIAQSRTAITKKIYNFIGSYQ